MTQAFDDYAASRPQYAATIPAGEFDEALKADILMADCVRKEWFDSASEALTWRDFNLLRLAIRALRNQGEPYYTLEVTTPTN